MNKIFDFQKNYVLENDRVKLQALKSNDINHLLRFAIDEPTLWQYSLISANGVENMSAYIKAALEAREKKDSYPFIVFDKKKNQFAGSTRFYDINAYHNTTQLGYTWYGKEFWGTGLNKNCKYLMLEFAFDQLDLERVEFRADNNNKRSIAAMKSIGCTIEGVLRNNCAGTTARRDSIVLSILKNEWGKSVKDNLIRKVRLENDRYSL